MRKLILSSAVLLLLSSARAAEPAIDWQPWSDELFTKAKAEQKLVLLDLGAVWCHWCHVMDENTYKDPKVIELLRSKYIAVRVDQDARPELSNRYEDYGWPATILFKWDGTELAKRRGYIPPRPMASMLQAFIDDPTPGPSVTAEKEIAPAASTALGPERRTALRDKIVTAYDDKRGGWGHIHKYLNWDLLEYCLEESAHDPRLEAMARQTLTEGLKLLDPAWGGVYQYSTDDDWEHPHFEKIMPYQAENMRIFAQAYVQSHDAKFKDAASGIRGYLKTFLTSPDGAFYTSQDADVVQGEHSGEYFKLDDAARRKQGIPRVDTHIYARDNGLAITGLCALYAATGDASVLEDAQRAATWIVEHRALPEGGFRHDEKDAGGPYLADTLCMTRAFLALFAVTAQRKWFDHATQAAVFMELNFRADAGYATSKASTAGLKFRPQYEENVSVARTLNLLRWYSGRAEFGTMAEHAMRYAASPALVDERGYGIAGTLLADSELADEPLHMTIVGKKDDPAAQALFATAIGCPVSYKRTDWQVPGDKPVNPDIEFPVLPQAAAFFCAQKRCSSPLYSAQGLAAKWKNKPAKKITLDR